MFSTSRLANRYRRHSDFNLEINSTRRKKKKKTELVSILISSGGGGGGGGGGLLGEDSCEIVPSANSL